MSKREEVMEKKLKKAAEEKRRGKRGKGKRVEKQGLVRTNVFGCNRKEKTNQWGRGRILWKRDEP